MNTLPSGVRARKAGSDVCERCDGFGNHESLYGGRRVACDTCEATGRVRFVEEAPEPVVTYLVTQGKDVIETGLHLQRLVSDVLKTFSEMGDESMIVWRVEEGGPEGRGPKAVALLRPDSRGRSVAVWL